MRDDLFQLFDRIRGLTAVEEREAQIVSAFRQRRIGRQRLTDNVHGLPGVLQLTLRFSKRRHELWITRSVLERGFELLLRTRRPPQIEIDVRQIEAGGTEGRIDLDGLAELRHRFGQQFLRALRAVGHAEQQVPLDRPGIGAKNGLQLPHILCEMR